MIQKPFFIITSVIHFSLNELSYSSTRSVYIPEERARQTRKTIETIRERVPAAKIILVEMGNKGDDYGLRGMTDEYINAGKHFWVRWAVNSRHKGFGEAVGLLTVVNYLRKYEGLFFKLSGRYFLNEEFKLAEWSGDKFSFRFYNAGVSTRLYAFPSTELESWKNALSGSLMQLWKGGSLEDILPRELTKNKIHKMDNLGVSGLVAPDGNVIRE